LLENILLENKEDLSSIKIADFGLSVQYDTEFMYKQTTFNDFCGTKIYMAPELWKGNRYSKVGYLHSLSLFKPIDIWSCGLIMYILIEGRHPLYNDGDRSEAYANKLMDPKWQFSENFTEYTKNCPI